MADQDVSGMGGVSPHDRKLYEQEYKHGADLFKRALEQYGKSDNNFQQAEFKEVMEKAMQVLNETAQELMKKELLKQNDQISKDFVSFQQHPDSKDAQQKLIHDLEKAKRSV